MKKLSEADTQSLNYNEINLLIMYYLTDQKPYFPDMSWLSNLDAEFFCKEINNNNSLNESDYCENAYPYRYWKNNCNERAEDWEGSLDAQVELAEKLGIKIEIQFNPKNSLYIFTVGGISQEGQTKRVGAELILRRLQETNNA